MPSTLEKALADLESRRDKLNNAIETLRGIVQDEGAQAPAAAPPRRRPGRPRKNAAAAAPAPKKTRKTGKVRKASAVKKPAAPKVRKTRAKAETETETAAPAPAPAPAAEKPAAEKPAAAKTDQASGAKKPQPQKLESRIEAYFAAAPRRYSTALEISQALGADDRGVRLSLGRMAKKKKVTRMADGRYRAWSA